MSTGDGGAAEFEDRYVHSRVQGISGNAGGVNGSAAGNGNTAHQGAK